MTESVIPRVLTIAGSDSGGGAGIEADLKTFTALRVFGMAAITSVTAQNTLGVTGVHDLPPEFVAEQIDDVAQDIGVDAAKTGMLSSAAIAEAVADSVARNKIAKLVVDPVMVAKSGDPLLRESAQQAVRERILPLAYVVTPNVPEAEVLAGAPIASPEAVEEAARRIHGLGARFVLVKGGHMAGSEAVDYLFDGETVTTFSARRIPTKNTHGTGCTYSAAIAAYLAKGRPVTEAVRLAKDYLSGAIKHSFPLGSGHGPLNHFWQANG
ncbi:MAG TPA: bifunctional hydroxymethylpyrimidine kinase/phosphomethylpyrimidine kinase [Candidatus Hydrogenedentes bacterium]|nr:bifunctional hydroxymethylpyrimidine kinase/phosphomethylpyrimidine kinase [Candidatus Hydrogenedentota bacterium]HQM48028.1 bifunctional hydroxymethylpyrimidine kinase/phosphomethylpyrimidine kinase [Candidatus Hydrogenedentota bacterium]